MNSEMTGSHRGTAQLTSRKPGNRWQQQFVSDTTVVQVGCRLQVLGIIIWEEHFEWSIFSDPLQITILKRNLDLQILEHLTQSSKSHYSWHTLGTRLCHNEWIISCRFRDGSWTLHRDTPISQDLKLCLFLSFHGLFPYDALRAKLVTWFQAPVTCIVSLMLVASLCHRRGISGFIWLQPVDACCTLCPVDPRKKLGVKIKHIIGQNHEPLLLGCTELFDPSAQLMEIV